MYRPFLKTKLYRKTTQYITAMPLWSGNNLKSHLEIIFKHDFLERFGHRTFCFVDEPSHANSINLPV